MVLGAILLAWRGYNGRRDDALEEFGGRAEMAAAAAGRFFDERLALLESIAESPALRSGDAAAMRSRPRPVLDGGPRNRRPQLRRRPTAGSARRRTPTPRQGSTSATAATSRPSWTANEPYVSEAVIGRVTGEPTVVLAVPVEDDGGTLIGLLAGIVHLDGAAEIIPNRGRRPPADRRPRTET